MRWERWLVGVAVAIIVFGIAMSVLAGTAVFAPVMRLVEAVFWPDAVPDPESRALLAWALAVWGATLAGFGICVAWIAAVPLAAGSRGAWWTLLAATVVWFALDTARSAAAGFWVNVAINAVIAIAILVPLARLRQRR